MARRAAGTSANSKRGPVHVQLRQDLRAARTARRARRTPSSRRDPAGRTRSWSIRSACRAAWRTECPWRASRPAWRRWRSTADRPTGCLRESPRCGSATGERVSGGVSRVGRSIRANSGIHRDTGSSSDSRPSSRSFSTASAVKLLVIDAMRNAVSGVTGACEARSRTPNDPTMRHAGRRSPRPRPSRESSCRWHRRGRGDRSPASPTPVWRRGRDR